MSGWSWRTLPFSRVATLSLFGYIGFHSDIFISINDVLRQDVWQGELLPAVPVTVSCFINSALGVKPSEETHLGSVIGGFCFEKEGDEHAGI